ncbi:DUF2164 family protein [Candidatus Uhrbacteria bacterium]|nr:DUF2164 family protein [Candidatus Uhrbacteria bacterium]
MTSNPATIAKQKRGLNVLTDEQRTEATKRIQTFFKKEHDLDLGMMAAEDILTFHLQMLEKHIYNKGLLDAKKLITDRFEMMGIDLDLLITT